MVISMKKLSLSLLVLALLLGFAAPARAEVEDGTVIPAKVVAPLMAWVEAQTGTKVPALPQVIASRELFQQILGRMGGKFAGRPRSVYVAGRVILDSEYWEEDDSTEQSLLVHELVHYAQSFMTTGWSCPDAREGMAYTLQNKWLEEHDDSPFVNVAWVRRMSSCGDSSTAVAWAR